MLELIRRGPSCAGAALDNEEDDQRRPIHGTVAHDACPARGKALGVHLPALDAVPGALYS